MTNVPLLLLIQQWLSGYPWPTSQTVFDRGSEFIGHDFSTMIRDDYGIKKKPISARNPQANSVIEHVHQTISNMIRTFEVERNYLDDDDPWAGILSATAFAVRSTYHTTLQATPGQLNFGRDLILNVQHYCLGIVALLCAFSQIRKMYVDPSRGTTPNRDSSIISKIEQL